MKDLSVAIKLKEVQRLDQDINREYSKPYLWNIFFKIDGSCLTIKDNFRLEGKAKFHFTEGSHGNLGNVDLSSTNEVQVPESIGLWRTKLTPLHIPHFEKKAAGNCGLIVILMEKKNVSLEGVEAGHRTLNRMVEESLNEMIEAFDPRMVDLKDVDGSVLNYFKSQADHMAQKIEREVTNAVVSNQSLLQNFWSLLKKDTLIGFETFTFSQDDFEANQGKITFEKEWNTSSDGHWLIKGEALTF